MEKHDCKFPGKKDDNSFRLSVCGLTGADSKRLMGWLVAASTWAILGNPPVIFSRVRLAEMPVFIGLGSPLAHPGRGPEEPWGGGSSISPLSDDFCAESPPRSPLKRGLFPYAIQDEHYRTVNPGCSLQHSSEKTVSPIEASEANRLRSGPKIEA